MKPVPKQQATDDPLFDTSLRAQLIWHTFSIDIEQGTNSNRGDGSFGDGGGLGKVPLDSMPDVEVAAAVAVVLGGGTAPSATSRTPDMQNTCH